MFTIQSSLGSILIKVPWMLHTTQSLCVYIQTYAFIIDILLQMIIYVCPGNTPNRWWSHQLHKNFSKTMLA